MEFKVSDLVEMNSRSLSKSDQFKEIKYLDTANLTEGIVAEVQVLDPSTDKVPSRAKRKVKENDILISTVRPNQKHYGIIGKNQEELIASTGFAVLTPKADLVDPYYLYKYLTTDAVTEYLQTIAENSTSAYPSIKPKVIGDLTVTLPQLKTQKRIGSFFRDIDSKMDMNSKIILNLEEIAQTVFRRWFVDFEFPNENGEPYKSSGGEMIENEIGEIPKGWKVRKLGDIAKIQNGFAFKSTDYTKEGIKVLRTLNIEKNGLLINNEDLKFLPESFYTEKKYFNQRLEKFDILMVMVGATIGKLGMVLSSNVPSLQNQNMWRFRSEVDSLSSTVLYYYVKDAVEKSLNWRSGSAREFFRKDSFSKISIAMPPASILLLSKSIFEDIFNKIDNLNSQNEILYNVQSLLLPKLLSGEIELQDETEVTEHVPVP